jgi:Family of unknown function (DUF5681)
MIEVGEILCLHLRRVMTLVLRLKIRAAASFTSINAKKPEGSLRVVKALPPAAGLLPIALGKTSQKDNHAMPYSHSTLLRIATRRAGAGLRLKELPMPDLDQIKQGEQETRDRAGRFAKGRSGNPAGRPRGCRDHVNRAARLLLAGESEAPTRKAVELALAGDPAALRLCLETHRRAVSRTRGRIHDAADP